MFDESLLIKLRISLYVMQFLHFYEHNFIILAPLKHAFLIRFGLQKSKLKHQLAKESA